MAHLRGLGIIANSMKSLLQKLVQCDSTAEKGEFRTAQILERYFREANIPCHIETWDGNRANCVARISGQGTRPGLMFLCHLDVVPPGDATWQHPPFSGLEVDGHVYGRGATDMKGGTAAAAVAIRNVLASGDRLLGDVLFAATAGEETDSCGVERLMAQATDLPELAGVIVPEPTDFSVINAHRGLLWLELTTQGKTAHGSAPHLGNNAIMNMATAMNLLNHVPLDMSPHPQLGSCSMSLNTIRGGKAFNVVPDRCTLGIDIRTLPGQDPLDIVRSIETLLEEQHKRSPQFKATVSVHRCVGALETDPEHDFVRQVCALAQVPNAEAVGFTTDAPSVVPLGVPIVIYGPGQGRVCHQPDESIALADVDRAITRYEQIIRQFLT